MLKTSRHDHGQGQGGETLCEARPFGMFLVPRPSDCMSRQGITVGKIND